MVVDNPPFAGVRTALETAHSFANTMVVSATPAPALEQEWGAAGLLDFIDEIAGQEFGPKREQLAAALRAGFSAQQSLMVGDAPGDHAAAEEHGIRFFPIVPGAEEESWRRFGSEAMPKFRAGTFDDAYQQALLDSYYAALDSHAGAPS
jgi:phosphoglycolate phosphatase-like HAD superfamily hydrolase